MKAVAERVFNAVYPRLSLFSFLRSRGKHSYKLSFLMQPYSQILASYACNPAQSRGRLYPEEESPNRTVFQRDRDRIIHSAAFRRLEYKTQVFVNHEGDHYRTRLTHTLEVSQLARSLSRALGLNEDLAEAVALAHDLGHTPFGHAGEEGLRDAMKDFGGFDHNAQTLRILTKLEHRYAGFDGLNLTWETLEGVAKHNGPVPEHARSRALKEYAAVQDLELETYAGAEAQVAALADDIAYGNHDIDDGLRSGMLTMDSLEIMPSIGDDVRAIKKKYGNLDAHRLTHEAIRRHISRMVTDLLEQTAENLKESGVQSVEDIRAHAAPIVSFSSAMQETNRALKAFLFEHMYRHYRVNRMASKARRVVKELFTFLLAEPECLPTHWRIQVQTADKQKAAEIVADFVAGMTDRFAIEEHRRLFDIAAGT